MKRGTPRLGPLKFSRKGRKGRHYWSMRKATSSVDLEISTIPAKCRPRLEVLPPKGYAYRILRSQDPVGRFKYFASASEPIQINVLQILCCSAITCKVSPILRKWHLRNALLNAFLFDLIFA